MGRPAQLSACPLLLAIVQSLTCLLLPAKHGKARGGHVGGCRCWWWRVGAFPSKTRQTFSAPLFARSGGKGSGAVGIARVGCGLWRLRLAHNRGRSRSKDHRDQTRFVSSCCRRSIVSARRSNSSRRPRRDSRVAGPILSRLTFPTACAVERFH